MKLKRTNYPKDLVLTPEHEKRGSIDHASGGELHPDIVAAYDYVDSILETSDDDTEYAWYGWGIREAFLAGISHASKK